MRLLCIVQANMDSMLKSMETNAHCRNLFETGPSGGKDSTAVGTQWEDDLFCQQYHDSANHQRPADVNFLKDPADARALQYGASYFELKDIRAHCTMSSKDSARLQSTDLGVGDYYGHILLQYDDDELVQALQVATGIVPHGSYSSLKRQHKP